jgi:hypothetical protein
LLIFKQAYAQPLALPRGEGATVNKKKKKRNRIKKITALILRPLPFGPLLLQSLSPLLFTLQKQRQQVTLEARAADFFIKPKGLIKTRTL